MYTYITVILIRRIRYKFIEIYQTSEMIIVNAEIAPIAEVVILVQNNLA